MNFEQKESYIEKKLAIAGSYLQWKIVYNELSFTCSDKFLMVSITF